MEWLGWIFSLPLVGWLVKETWTNITHTKMMKKQSENEHTYFKKRLVFETKSSIYKELNQKIKKMIGSLNDYRDIEKIMTSYYPKKFEQYVNDNGYTKINLYSAAENNYKYDEEVRAEINLNYHFRSMEKLQFDFSNYVSLQNYILTEKENEILLELNNSALEMIRYIEGWKEIWEKEVVFNERKNEIIDMFKVDYNNKFSNIEKLMYEFMEEIRKEMFM